MPPRRWRRACSPRGCRCTCSRAGRSRASRTARCASCSIPGDGSAPDAEMTLRPGEGPRAHRRVARVLAGLSRVPRLLRAAGSRDVEPAAASSRVAPGDRSRGSRSTRASRSRATVVSRAARGDRGRRRAALLPRAERAASSSRSRLTTLANRAKPVVVRDEAHAEGALLVAAEDGRAFEDPEVEVAWSAVGAGRPEREALTQRSAQRRASRARTRCPRRRRCVTPTRARRRSGLRRPRRCDRGGGCRRCDRRGAGTRRS